jgi:TPR repeat protein
VALTRLLALGEASGTTRQDIFNEFSTIIDERGDADALIFAASVVGDAAKKRDFLRRAVSVIGCDFDNAYKLAEAWAEAGDVAETMHWLEVSQHLAEDKGSRIGVIANRYAALPGDAYQQVALKLYEQGAGLGDGPSLDHLLKLYGDPSSTAYSPTTAVRLFKDVMPKAKAPDLVAIIDKLNQAPAVIRTSVLQSVSIPELYRHLAEGGDVVAMVALAKYVQDNAASAADGKVAADWLKKAADLGDSKAMVALAKAFAMGVGVKPSAETAKALLVQAAAKGSNEARKLLANMS